MSCVLTIVIAKANEDVHDLTPRGSDVIGWDMS